MSVYNFSDYKEFVNTWITAQPKNGHGQLRKISATLQINSVVMSQVFRGSRELTMEQALGVAKFMGLGERERDYFLLLVQKARAGSHELKTIFEKQLQEMNVEAQKLKNRVDHQKLTDEDRATFYSQWYYSAVRLGVSITEFSNASAIADHLKLERSTVTQVLEFLDKHKLIIEKDGKYNLGPQVTHIGSDSPLVTRHHTNWRMKGLQAMEKPAPADLYYTGPMALSKEAAVGIRKLLIELVEKSTKMAAASDSEVLKCLNIDWFDVGRDSV